MKIKWYILIVVSVVVIVDVLKFREAAIEGQRFHAESQARMADLRKKAIAGDRAAQQTLDTLYRGSIRISDWTPYLEPPYPLPAATGCRDLQSGVGVKLLVGETVTLEGKFDLHGMTGPFIICGDEEIYLEPHPNPVTTIGPEWEKLQGNTVKITGILRFQHFPPCPDPQDRKGCYQHPPDYYYFDLEAAKMRLGDKAWQPAPAPPAK